MPLNVEDIFPNYATNSIIETMGKDLIQTTIMFISLLMYINMMMINNHVQKFSFKQRYVKYLITRRYLKGIIVCLWVSKNRRKKHSIKEWWWRCRYGAVNNAFVSGTEDQGSNTARV
jgi:hypothetical protein